MADAAERVDDALYLARTYNETGNHERAREVVSRCLAENPNEPALLTQYAYAELLLKNYASAAQSAYAALSTVPNDESAMRMYALALDYLERRYDALWMAYRTVVAHPNSPEAHRLYAKLLQKARAFSSALLAVNESLRLDPTNVDALITRGSVLQDLNKVPESTAAYREALVLDPGNATALHDIAINELRAGKFAPALRGFLRAAGLDPALGSLVRGNIAVAVARVLTRVTVAVAALGPVIMLIGTSSSKGEPTVPVRAVTGLITALLILRLARLLRAAPRRVVGSALRQHRFLVARAVHATLGLAIATWATFAAGSAWHIVAGFVVLVSGLLLVAWGS